MWALLFCPQLWQHAEAAVPRRAWLFGIQMINLVGTGHTQKQSLSNAFLCLDSNRNEQFSSPEVLSSLHISAPTAGMQGSSLPLATHLSSKTEFQIVKPKAGCKKVLSYHSTHTFSFLLVEGLAMGVVPDHLPPTRKCYVTKRNEYKICVFKLGFSSQNDLLRNHVCFKLLVTGKGGVCLPLSLCKTPPLPFSGLA